jgi:hypothetical protein
VTHDEARVLVPSYSIGVLDDARAAAVRAHLASGCLDCLDGVFTRRALARRRPATAVLDWPVEPPPRPARPTRRRGGLVALVAIAAGGGWLLGALGLREQATRLGRLTSRVDGLETARAAVLTRLDRMESRPLPAPAPAPVVAPTPASAEPDPETETRALREALAARTREVARLRAATATDGAGADLLAMPGTALLPLSPQGPFRDGRGHVVWNAGRPTVVVYAFGLPARERYRLRVDDGDGASVEIGPVFTPRADGSAVVPLRLATAPGGVGAVRVLLEPWGRPVLAWSSR